MESMSDNLSINQIMMGSSNMLMENEDRSGVWVDNVKDQIDQNMIYSNGSHLLDLDGKSEVHNSWIGVRV